MSDYIEDLLWKEILNKLALQAGMLVSTDETGPLTCTVLSAGNVPIEPFNGAENYAVRDVIRDCLDKQPIAHEHGIGNLALSNLIQRFGRNCSKAAVATYIPVLSSASRLFFLGFPSENRRDSERISRALPLISPLVTFISDQSKLAYFERKLEYTERYIREIGHDLASNMQAVFGQLGYMCTGKLTEKAMIEKAGEALREVKNIYGIAESLDVTLDRAYAIHAKARFDISELLKQLCDEYEAEAQEKRIKLDWTVVKKGLFAHADQKSLRLCLVHLLVNAIKYSHDNTTVEVTASLEQGEIRIAVSNRGVGLPAGPEAQMIWEFGYRSKHAKERHVNGSGIGLYTAKRIVVAHGGRIWHEQNNGDTRFILAIPNS